MDILTKQFVALNAFVFRATGGRLGGQLGRQSVLLLHTAGRKSGKPYATPLSFYRDEENYIVVASNWGKETDPNWFRNLLHRPAATIQVKNRTLAVTARPAQDAEYARLWELVTQQNPQYAQYASRTQRKIPVVVLTPHEGRGTSTGGADSNGPAA